jgi:hypothetical protein
VEKSAFGINGLNELGMASPSKFGSLPTKSHDSFPSLEEADRFLTLEEVTLRSKRRKIFVDRNEW